MTFRKIKQELDGNARLISGVYSYFPGEELGLGTAPVEVEVPEEHSNVVRVIAANPCKLTISDGATGAAPVEVVVGPWQEMLVRVPRSPVMTIQAADADKARGKAWVNFLK